MQQWIRLFALSKNFCRRHLRLSIFKFEWAQKKTKNIFLGGLRKTNFYVLSQLCLWYYIDFYCHLVKIDCKIRYCVNQISPPVLTLFTRIWNWQNKLAGEGLAKVTFALFGGADILVQMECGTPLFGILNRNKSRGYVGNWAECCFNIILHAQG